MPETMHIHNPIAAMADPKIDYVSLYLQVIVIYAAQQIRATSCTGTDSFFALCIHGPLVFSGQNASAPVFSSPVVPKTLCGVPILATRPTQRERLYWDPSRFERPAQCRPLQSC
jgi:hypothetical protein